MNRDLKVKYLLYCRGEITLGFRKEGGWVVETRRRLGNWSLSCLGEMADAVFSRGVRSVLKRALQRGAHGDVGCCVRDPDPQMALTVNLPHLIGNIQWTRDDT